jgi:methylenetetrahydrofolate reductase (NADPH)
MNELASGAMAPLLARPRFEVLPLPGVLEQMAVLPAGSTVTVTSSPSRGLDATVGVAEGLAAAGYHAVPHVAARGLLDRAQLAETLHRLDAAGISEVFVVGGDAREPVGAFPDGLSVLRAMSELGHRMTDVGVPSYPEGHHLIDEAALWAALRAKQAHATYTVTQMCFDADTVCAFAAEARRRGISLPLVAGIAGPVEVGKLLRVGVRIGIGESMRFVRGHGSPAGKLLRPAGYRPDELVRGLGGHVAAGRCALAGVHVYTFNHLDATLRWLHQAHRRAAG